MAAPRPGSSSSPTLGGAVQASAISEAIYRREVFGLIVLVLAGLCVAWGLADRGLVCFCVNQVAGPAPAASDCSHDPCVTCCIPGMLVVIKSGRLLSALRRLRRTREVRSYRTSTNSFGHLRILLIVYCVVRPVHLRCVLRVLQACFVVTSFRRDQAAYSLSVSRR
jgi:hypothetical protein